MPLTAGGVATGLAGWATGVAVGTGVGTDDGTSAPGASGTSGGGAGALASLSRYRWLPPVGGFNATTTSGGVVLAIAMASTFLLPLGDRHRSQRADRRRAPCQRRLALPAAIAAGQPAQRRADRRDGSIRRSRAGQYR